MIQDKQDLIIQHNFTYKLPKFVLGKLSEPTNKNMDLDNTIKYMESRRNDGKEDGKHGQKQQIKSLKYIVTDPDSFHMRWHIKENEIFNKKILFNSKKIFPKW